MSTLGIIFNLFCDLIGILYLYSGFRGYLTMFLLGRRREHWLWRGISDDFVFQGVTRNEFQCLVGQFDLDVASKFILLSLGLE